jgi:uncharacterized protein
MTSAGPRCPICRQALPSQAAAAPFCSPRCRAIDLGQWLSGRYVIPGEKNVDERGLHSDDD